MLASVTLLAHFEAFVALCASKWLSWPSSASSCSAPAKRKTMPDKLHSINRSNERRGRETKRLIGAGLSADCPHQLASPRTDLIVARPQAAQVSHQLWRRQQVAAELWRELLLRLKLDRLKALSLERSSQLKPPEFNWFVGFKPV